MKNYETFRFEVDGGVATITLDRPERLNALTFAVYRELTDCFYDLRQRADVDCVLITGSGRGFCSACGSLLLWKTNGSDRTSIMMGCLDKPTGVTGRKHIFCAEKGDYYEIDDGLPQYAAYE